jgi:uncharacterized membrane protein YhaH (DUF805 family)
MKYYKDAVIRYFDFEGRTSRKYYWMFVLVNIVILIVIRQFEELQLGDVSTYQGGILSNLYNFFIFIPSISICVRRLHDINKSGWWILLFFIPIIGMIWLIILNIKKGDVGENEYGKPPVA